MITTINDSEWTITLVPEEELLTLYEHLEGEKAYYVFGLTQYSYRTIYLNKYMSRDEITKTLRHELMHAYIWMYSSKQDSYSEEDVCNFYSGASPTIERVVKEFENYRKNE